MLRLNSFLPAMALLTAGAAAHLHAQQLPLAPGVEKLCSVEFDKDARRPARVEDQALPCLEQTAQKLKDTPGIKVVLVGIAHPLYDHAEAEHGVERMREDATGLDVRFSDVAAYRAVNTKAYLTQWLKADATRIIPTTDEYALGRRVIVYTVPGDADFNHNYTKTTPTNELKCTIKPCPIATEDVLTPQPRGKIVVASSPTKAH
ncbi:hypothetical protein SAMN05421770_104276 [Granulicella rosea]|uniref:Uncharacterized protein n=1 Tax=Granulicella rosea TaxID=474952 RepID=A0A239K4U7_9BACT|nr:hypothetical protein [Granulicella rosea]SNT12663.1 hypothetical protein SAMN05421770_104276 [Granulicella rosea]